MAVTRTPLDIGGTIPIPTEVTPSVSVSPQSSFLGLGVNPFSGLESWLSQYIEQPIVSFVGTEVSPLASELGAIAPEIESELPSLAKGLSGAEEGIAGIALSLATQIPQVKSAIADVSAEESKLASEFTSGLANLTGSIEASVKAVFQPYEQEFATLGQDLSNIETYAAQLVQEAPTVQLIEKQVTQIPEIEITDIENWWNNTALPDIKGVLGDIQPELTALGDSIDTLESKITGLVTDIENLPEEVEQYVVKGVETGLKKLWKKIEIPTIIIGGIVLWKLFYPSCPTCGVSHSKGKHIKTPVLG